MTITEAKNKLLNIARREVGYCEQGGNNYTKYTTGNWDNQFYGWELQNQPWCDVFVDWCFCEAFGIQTGAAMTYQHIGSGSALCSASASFYQSNGAFFRTPEPGDQVFFYVNGAINHTGLVESVSGNQVITIEGNSSDSVARRTYSLGESRIAGYGRPKWSLVANQPSDPDKPKDEPKDDEPQPFIILRRGSIGENVKKAQEKLISLGYDCGPEGADGDFGYNTYMAVIKFQQDNKLLPIDGEIGPITWEALFGKESQQTQTNFAVGDIVYFKGDTHYVNGISTNKKSATPGKAKITQISRNKNIKHPYHLIHIDNTSNVYGWVDEGTIEKI